MAIKFLGRKREGVCYHCGREIKDVYIFEIDGIIEELGSECQKKVTGFNKSDIVAEHKKMIEQEIGESLTVIARCESQIKHFTDNNIDDDESISIWKDAIEESRKNIKELESWV